VLSEFTGMKAFTPAAIERVKIVEDKFGALSM
jgi:hypothetical protein